MLDPNLLTAYIETFFGYGSWNAPIWFVGMEEGGGDTLEEITRRVSAWDARGRQSLEDLRDYHEAIEIKHWFGAKAPLQPTWRSLIRILLAAEGKPLTTDEARRVQREELGRSDGRTALLELLPLAAPSQNAPWLYSQFSLELLTMRAAYEHAVRPMRERALTQRIDQHQPALVVTYGNSGAWRRLFGANDLLNAKAWTTRRGRTLIVCTYHPGGARSNAHWDEIGEYMRRNASPLG